MEAEKGLGRMLALLWLGAILAAVAALFGWGALSLWPEGFLDMPIASYTLLLLLKAVGSALLWLGTAVFGVWTAFCVCSAFTTDLW